MTITSESKVGEKLNLFNRFRKVADKNPDIPAFKADGGRGKVYTYADAKQQIQKLAAILSTPEFENCHEIGLISENRPEWGIAYMAISALGKTVVPIDVNLKESEIDYIFKHAKLKVIITSVRFESLLKEHYPDVRLFSFNEASPNYWQKCTVEQPFMETSDADPYDIAVLIYTSGTTGAPKAVELTHANLIANLDEIQNSFEFYQDTFLSILPLHHTFEATGGFLTPLMNGCTIVYARSLKSKEIAEDIAYNKVTIMIGVPLLFEKLYHAILRKIKAAPAVRRGLFNVLYEFSRIGWKTGNKWGKPLFKSLRNKGDLATIRLFVSGGAPIPSHIARFYNLIGFDFFQGYGMTECAPVITANRPEDIKFGSVGTPLANVEIKIDNPNEKGIGEILTRGPNVTPGYRNNPDETAKLIRDGWLYTGDLGKIDSDGHLWITGRKKNLIVSAAGKNIYPEQIEEKLLSSNIIMESVIFGRSKKDKQGEEVCAIIVPDLEHMKVFHNIDPKQPNTEKIRTIFETEIKKINTEMAEYKRITYFEIQLEELEKTSTKKVKRFIYK